MSPRAPRDPDRKALGDLVKVTRQVRDALRDQVKLQEEYLILMRRQENPEVAAKLAEAFAAGFIEDARKRGAHVPPRAPSVEIRDGDPPPAEPPGSHVDGPDDAL